MKLVRSNVSTRRTVVTGAGMWVASNLLPAAGFAQPSTASDDFRELRARLGGLGALLRVRRGEEVKVRLINDLPAEMTLHWHGVRLPNAMDGVPGLTQRPVAPGSSFDYRFRPPDAGTFWYRPALRSPGPDRGAYGLLIVDEAQPVDADRDVALVLDESPHLTVNGLPALDIPVIANERVRLRLLNAAEARFMTLRIERHAATVMAIDGQPAEPFVARDSQVTLAPGNRLDLFADMTLEPGSTASLFVTLNDTEVPLARLVYDAQAPARALPRSETPPLPANALPAQMDFRGALRVDIALDANAADATIPTKPLFSVKRGRTIVLAIANRANAPHTLHTHGHCVRLLDRLDDGWKPYWLDTVPVLPQQTTRVAFVADNPGKWLLHARMIGGDANILRWFEVV